MNESWALYIDEEGFAQHWDDTMRAFQGLNAMMEALCRIGQNVYPQEGDRLFCHQFGDGFLVGSDFHENDLSRAVLIAIATLRHVLSASRVARASLVEGNISDIAGCYPKEVRESEDRGRVSLGAGLLTTNPVLGEGLLRSVGLEKRGPRGPLFLVDSALAARLHGDILLLDAAPGIVSVNWLRGEPVGLAEIQRGANLKMESESERVERLLQYIDTNESLTEEWKYGARTFLLSQYTHN